ncbi:hypothetical protein O6P43_002264 [Quillaja saponaria]|uniref:Uncharacterized protein n=1 Tax=Quillaja saponaria TaxID=32244 RepID=A0AAD7VK65_QUISA|nr:hypothetical protein O6P43_002264 [Quillaja saponaria]
MEMSRHSRRWSGWVGVSMSLSRENNEVKVENLCIVRVTRKRLGILSYDNANIRVKFIEANIEGKLRIFANWLGQSEKFESVFGIVCFLFSLSWKTKNRLEYMFG